MKLDLPKQWFEANLPLHNPEVGAGAPASVVNQQGEPDSPGSQREDEIVEANAFGTLVQLLRRDRKLTFDQLAAAAQIAAPELLSIETDPKYVPKPRTVCQLSQYFGLPDRPLMALANVSTVRSGRLREAAVRFAASSSHVRELSREERAALTEFVQVLAAPDVE